MAALADITDAVRDVAGRVGPAVVGLGRGWGRGSGVVTEPGVVITNAHNLRGDEVTVAFADGRRETGSVAGADPDADLAVIEVSTGDIEPLEWPAGADAPAPGAVVFALANPGGRGQRTTLGIVSSAARSFRGPRGRRIRGSIEHTAPLPRGSSGGPLVDGDGRLLGLNTVRVDGGLILAIAADDELRERVAALRRGEQRARPRLGVAVAPAHVARRLRRAVGLEERDGLLVRAVERGSAADAAGIQRGDLLVAVAGEAVSRFDDVFDRLDAAGDELGVTVLRGVEEQQLTVKLEPEGK